MRGWSGPRWVCTRTRGTGTEKLSLLDTTQEWGPRLPATVTGAGGGCWTYKVEYSTNHWQDWTYCPADVGLREAGGTSFQSFDFVAFTVDDLIVFRCDPLGDTIRLAAEPGESWEQSCDGSSEARGTHVTSAGTNTFVGIEAVEVGGDEVRATTTSRRGRSPATRPGPRRSTPGTRCETASPLETERTVRVESPSPIGQVVYTERGGYRLVSLVPER
ncbi:MAG: hypothetical protein M5T61_14860 [Acidimicrobiia bacterium]|nr:hypothetical protein [Acidimicrobiia bacterium]